ncbi:hypothetical protein NPIL_420441 [Nephila pilipes]|uniref:Uncharacterized protein n=1 Tax=Nephila pilipes TaxID=299642 RepID=A0A8X6ISK4_NEPPI|nr:hypothetical protein NPIL_420441 [Nephila pilipes]
MLPEKFMREAHQISCAATIIMRAVSRGAIFDSISQELLAWNQCVSSPERRQPETWNNGTRERPLVFIALFGPTSGLFADL